MKMTLDPIKINDREEIVDILNHYIENSMAAYLDRPVPYEFFDGLMKLCEGYPTVAARDKNKRLVGFGLLKPYHSAPTFSKTAEITYFLHPESTGKGIGRAILEKLVSDGRNMGLTSIIASISSINEGSIRFHLKNGFVECGRLAKVGIKGGYSFDVVYCQKMLY